MEDDADRLYRIFQDLSAPLEQVKNSAAAVYRLIRDLSPLIEAHTSMVCPDCREVCCRNRHSYHDRSDQIYMSALGIRVNNSSPVADDAPCRFISQNGCMLERPERPFRCTWFFCEPLLEHMSGSMPPRVFRDFNNRLAEITSRRMDMLNSFELISTRIPRHVPGRD